MRRRLYLMRHADVSYVDETGRPVSPEDVPLTARGVEQAEAARDALAGVELDLVVSSALPRTAETAAIVAPGHDVERLSEFSEWRGGVAVRRFAAGAGSPRTVICAGIHATVTE